MGIALQHEVLRSERRIGEGSRGCHLEGRLILPPGLPLPERTQFCRARVKEIRANALTGRVQVEGTVEVEVVYLAPEQEAEVPRQPEYLFVWPGENGGDAIAFAQEIPMAGVQPGMHVEARAEVANLMVEPLDISSLRYAINLELSVDVLSAQEIRIATEVGGEIEHLEVIKEYLHLETTLGRLETEIPVNVVLPLSEVKPDLVRVIARQIRLGEVKAEFIRGRVAVEGRLEVSAVYISRGEDGVQSVEISEWGGEGRTPIGFEAFLELPANSPDVSLSPEARLGRLSLEPIGPREVRLDATICLKVQATQLRQVPVVTRIAPGPSELVDLQQKEITLSHLAGQGEQEITVETTLDLPPGRPDLERILQITATPVGLTAQAAEGKCLVDGWLDISLLYLASATGGGQPSLASADWAKQQGTGVPVTEILGLPEAGPGLGTALVWGPARVTLERLAPRTIQLTVNFPVQVKVIEERTLGAIVDAALVPLAPVAGRPSMLFYVVQPGDDLWTVARRYGTTTEALARLNKLADPDSLDPGRKLLIPKSPVAV